MIRIGIVGIGFMGRIHYLASQRLKGGKVAAVCSRDPAKLAGDWRNTRGNFGPEPGQVDLSGVKKYAASPRCSPTPRSTSSTSAPSTDQHAPLAIQALKAGKHVLVEKAIALRPQDADAMVAAAKQAGKLLMVAHVLPFFPEFAFAAEAIREREVRQAARGALQARHREAGLVGGHRRRRQDRRPGRRSAHSRHALHRPRLRRAEAGVRGRHRRGRRGHVPDDVVPLRPRRPGGDVFERRGLHERAAVRPRLRDLPGEGELWSTTRAARR